MIGTEKEIIEFMNGRKVTWGQYAREIEDEVTEFCATREDLGILALALADEYRSEKLMNLYCTGRSPAMHLAYVRNRLNRVLEYMCDPDMTAKVNEKLVDPRYALPRFRDGLVEEEAMPEFFKQYIAGLSKPQLDELYEWLDTEPTCLRMLIEALQERGKEES